MSADGGAEQDQGGACKSWTTSAQGQPTVASSATWLQPRVHLGNHDAGSRLVLRRLNRHALSDGLVNVMVGPDIAA